MTSKFGVGAALLGTLVGGIAASVTFLAPAAKAGPGGFTSDLAVEDISRVSPVGGSTTTYQVRVRNLVDDDARQPRISFAPVSTGFVGTPVLVNSSQPGLTAVCTAMFASGSGSGHCDLGASLKPGHTATIQFVAIGTGPRLVSAQVFSDSPDGINGVSAMANNYMEKLVQ